MFDKVKQLGDLAKMRSQAMKLQKELERISKTYEKGKVRVRVRGDQKIDYLEIDGVEQKELKETINNALKDIQKEAAKKMMEMGGGLTGLLRGV